MNNVQCIYHTMHPSPLEGTSSKAHQELCGEAVQVREGFQKDRTPFSAQISAHELQKFYWIYLASLFKKITLFLWTILSLNRMNYDHLVNHPRDSIV